MRGASGLPIAGGGRRVLRFSGVSLCSIAWIKSSLSLEQDSVKGGAALGSSEELVPGFDGSPHMPQLWDIMAYFANRYRIAKLSAEANQGSQSGGVTGCEALP